MGVMRAAAGWLGFRSAGSVDSAGGTSPLPGVVPPERDARGAITLDRALTVPAAYRAITILATAGAQLELGVWRSGREIDTPGLVSRPDVYRTLSGFLKRTIISLAGTGNAYWRHYRGPEGNVVNVEALNALGVTIEHDHRGRRTYHVTDPIRGSLSLPARDVSHLRLMEVPGHLEGLGPIQACRSSLAGALDLRDYADNWFSDSAIPTGVLTTQNQLTPEQADSYKNRWKATQATRDVAVLGQGLAYNPIVLKPGDAQFLESQQFSVTDIARLFGVPAAYLLAEVNGNSMTYQNLEQADTAFLRYTLMAYLTEIEDALSAVLPRGQRARFKVAGLLRPDALTRARVHQAYAAMGAITVNEIRAEEGLDPVPGGDQLTTTSPAPARQGAADGAS